MEASIEKLLDYAIENKISDIHLTKSGELISLAYRTPQGLVAVPGCVPNSVLSSLLYQARLDISFKAKPQTGRLDHYYNYQKYSIRVAMMQSFENLSIVLRILNQYQFQSLTDLTSDGWALQQLAQLAQLEYGVVVFSGPTGSGKTTSAYTLLNQFRNKAVYTVEDPIEVHFSDFVQIQVNEQLHFGFDEGIKHILRHDPDIIFIGEVRDDFSAKMAIRCALSGHLVILTVHSATTHSTLNRFLDFGVNRFDMVEVMKAIVNQRLFYQSQQDRLSAKYNFLVEADIKAKLERPEAH